MRRHGRHKTLLAGLASLALVHSGSALGTQPKYETQPAVVVAADSIRAVPRATARPAVHVDRQSPRVSRSRPLLPGYQEWARGWAARKVSYCESSGNPSVVANNGGTFYYGKWQFDMSTWRSVGGPGIPSQQSEDTQDYYAYRLYQQRGWQPWQCASILGIR